jgi:hypothetical protein
MLSLAAGILYKVPALACPRSGYRGMRDYFLLLSHDETAELFRRACLWQGFHTLAGILAEISGMSS